MLAAKKFKGCIGGSGGYFFFFSIVIYPFKFMAITVKQYICIVCIKTGIKMY